MIERMSHRFMDVKTGETFTGRDLLLALIKETEGAEKCDWIRFYIRGLPDLQSVVGSKSFDVLVYIYSHLNFYDNTFVGSYETISQNTGISIATVTRVMGKFQEADIIRPREIKSTWMMNPHYGFAGRKEKEAMLEDRYWDCKSKTHFTRHERKDENA